MEMEGKENEPSYWLVSGLSPRIVSPSLITGAIDGKSFVLSWPIIKDEQSKGT